MSDYSNTHWLKDQPENFHCMPDKNSLFDLERGRVRGRIDDCSLKIPELFFQPEKWQVDKNTLRSTIDALRSGLEHTNAALIEHDANLGRTTRKNKSWAETLESDIRLIEDCIKKLKLVEVENSTHYP